MALTFKYSRPARIQSRKVFDQFDKLWRGKVLRNGSTYKEYSAEKEMDLDIMMASDMDQLRTIEKLKHLE